MKPAICTAILLVLSAVFLLFHEMLMQTWRPMFRLMILSFVVALFFAFLLFRYTDRHAQSRARAIGYTCFAIFSFTVIWNLLWAISEQGLIQYYRATYGPDDTGGRYFYPGDSGMGYARALSRPFDLFWNASIRGVCVAVLLGIPLGFIFRPHSINSEQGSPSSHKGAGGGDPS